MPCEMDSQVYFLQLHLSVLGKGAFFGDLKIYLWICYSLRFYTISFYHIHTQPFPNSFLILSQITTSNSVSSLIYYAIDFCLCCHLLEHGWPIRLGSCFCFFIPLTSVLPTSLSYQESTLLWFLWPEPFPHFLANTCQNNIWVPWEEPHRRCLSCMSIVVFLLYFWSITFFFL